MPTMYQTQSQHLGYNNEQNRQRTLIVEITWGEMVSHAGNETGNEK